MQLRVDARRKLKIWFQNNKGWVYLLPILTLMVIFTFYPLIKTILISFDPTFRRDIQTLSPGSFSFDNYRALFAEHSDFGLALKNTALIVFVTVPLSTMIALGICVSLMSVKRIRSFFQTIFFLPYITNTIAIGLVFAVLFDYQSGLVNSFLGLFGIGKTNWLNPAAVGQHGYPAATNGAMRAVTLFYITWSGLPFKILIFMGALQGINKQYYDAAKIDGTSSWRTFYKITVPLISPMILYVVITSLIGAFKTYAAVIGLFNDPTLRARMNTVVGYVYDKLADSGSGYAQGAAGAVVLFLIILALTFVSTWASKKKVHY